mmetsp:Transcript_8091/g.23810  ORF Transcript_8091/g.23810 Transcript_8091/m.23810 type:complete len:432 (-) Transcript_8091:53-1348(-)
MGAEIRRPTSSPKHSPATPLRGGIPIKTLLSAKLKESTDAGPRTFTKAGVTWCIVILRLLGVSVAMVANITGRCPRTVRSTFKKWQEEGSMEKTRGTGKKRIIPDNVLRQFAKKVRREKSSSLRQACDTRMASVTTWWRGLKRASAARFVRRKSKAGYVLNRTHRMSRVKWCRAILKRASSIGRYLYLQRISFTDSKIFLTAELKPNGHWEVARGAEDSDTSDADSEGRSEGPARRAFRVHCYGGISWFGFTRLLTNISGTGNTVFEDIDAPEKRGVNAKEYQTRILPVLLKDLQAIFAKYGLKDKWIFQQDGARPHTAAAHTPLGKNCRSIIKKYAKNCWWTWPSRSPDLSLIESVWARMLQIMVEDGREYQTLADFEKHIQDVWKRLSADREYRESLFWGKDKSCLGTRQGFYGRLAACIAAKGGRIPK